MNWVDIAIIVVFLFYLFEGVRRGFIEQVLELIGFFATIFLALWLYHPVTDWIVANIGIDATRAEPVAFIVTWLAFQAIYSLLLHFLYPLIPSIIRTATPNRLAGLIPAFAKAFILVSVIVTVMILMPIPETLRSQVDDSALGSRFVRISARVETSFSKIFGQDLRQSLTVVLAPPQTEKIVDPNTREKLNFTYISGQVDAQSEQKMFNLVNQEREKLGLKKMVWNEELAKVARAHCQDMLKNGYFGHVNLDNIDPFTRMKEAGIIYQVAGENLAFAMTVDLAHNGLMRSEGHRKNILDAEFGRVGIGVIDAGKYGKMFAQEFTN